MISKRKLSEHVWLLDDNGESTGYIVIGAEKADFILHGHTKDFDPVSLLTDLVNGIKEITNQKGTEISDSDDAYEWFGGVGKIHYYGKDHNAICYRVENI